jgi:4-hydroxybenzoate polyprenyltransferase
MSPTLGIGLALILSGLVSLLFLGWFGFLIAIVGVVVVIAYAAGFGKRAAQPGP